MSATMLANDGAPTEVPPMALRLPSEPLKPFTQLPWEQIKDGSISTEALNETSGTSRALSFGTPGATCQDGFGKSILRPPPVEARCPSKRVSFHAISGMYDRAEPLVPLLPGPQ